MNIIKIAYANIKRRKSSAFTFLIMSFLASFMMYLALTLFMGIQTFFDEKHEQLLGSHYTVIVAGEESNEYLEDYMKNSEYTKLWKAAECFLIEGDISGTDKTGTSIVCLNAEDFLNSDILPITYIEPLASLPENAIVVPYGMKVAGVQAGDKMTITKPMWEM